MTVKSVIEEAMVLIGRKDAADLLNAEEGGWESALQTCGGEVKELAEALLFCFNAVEDELARFYFPLEFTEKIRGSGGRFYFTSFKYRPVELSEVSADGRKIRYEKFPQYISAEAEILTVRYFYSPDKKTFSDESSFDGDAVSARLIACGIAAEYCVINGEITAADMWESKYRREIDRARLKYAPALRIPPRRWV